MKLHHFVATTLSEEGNRARTIGRALAPPAAVAQPVVVQPVSEVKLADIKKLDDKPAKKAPAAKVDTDAMHDFAVSQLEDSSCAYNAHHKIKHYD